MTDRRLPVRTIRGGLGEALTTSGELTTKGVTVSFDVGED
jgi:hypothetical protein